MTTPDDLARVNLGEVRELARHLVEACALMGTILEPGPRLRVVTDEEETSI